MRLRPPDPAADGEAVLAVMAARDVADIGRPDVELDDVVGDWARPSADVERDFVVAEDEAGAIVGYAFVGGPGAVVIVHPEHQGRGIEEALVGATEARMRERGQPLQQMLTATYEPLARVLRERGYERVHVYQRMRAQLDAVPPPDAANVRTFDLGAEGEAVHALIEEAFGEIAGNVPSPYADWRALQERSEPAFRLALDDEQGLAAAAVGDRWEGGIGYVAQLAVARRARGRGYGRTLLLALFDRFRSAGLTVADLSVHGANAPATGLYTSVGMAPDYTQERWERPGPAQMSA